MKNIFNTDYNIKSNVYSIAGAVMMALGIVGMGSCKPVVEDDHLPPITNTNTNTKPGGNEHVGEDTIPDVSGRTVVISFLNEEHLPRDSARGPESGVWTFDGSGMSFVLDSAMKPDVARVIVRAANNRVYDEHSVYSLPALLSAHQGMKARPEAMGKIEYADTLVLNEPINNPSDIQGFRDLGFIVKLDTIAPDYTNKSQRTR